MKNRGSVRKNQITTPREYGYDYTLLVAIIFLVVFGLIMLYSISYHTGITKYGDPMFFVIKQGRYALLGLVAMMCASLLYGLCYYLCDYIYWLGIVLIFGVRLYGVAAGGATRWLEIGTIQFQPSEIVKIGVILYIPKLLCDYKTDSLERKDLIKVFLYVAGPAILVNEFTSNLSTALIIGGIGSYVILLVTKNQKKIIRFIIGASLVGACAVKVFGNILLAIDRDYRMERVLVWINPEQYSDAGGYQVVQALYAIGAGGFWGKGLGNGMQKLSSIPEVQNDMIFAAICEELGIFGVAVMFLLFITVLYRLYKITINASTLYESLVVAGIFAHIAIQVVFNIAVVTAILPNTGVTLPFISYGGTALLIAMCELGIALGISRR